MRNRLYRYSAVLLLGALLAACSKVPDGILSEKKMQAVQVDMQLAEAMINLDSKAFSDNARKEALYQSIFRKYDITQAEYDSSLIWYGRHLDIYMKVYDRVLADLNKRQKALGDVQASAAPVSKQPLARPLDSAERFLPVFLSCRAWNTAHDSCGQFVIRCPSSSHAFQKTALCIFFGVVRFVVGIIGCRWVVYSFFEW